MKERKRIHCLWAGNFHSTEVHLSPSCLDLAGLRGGGLWPCSFQRLQKGVRRAAAHKKIFLAHIGGRTDMEWETLNHFNSKHTKKEDWVNAAQVEFYVVVF